MLNIDFLQKAYFPFDKPVPYKIGDKTIDITPIMLEKSEMFLASINILQIDKNSAPAVEIIQMSYLEFLGKIVAAEDEMFEDKMANILKYCCGIDNWYIGIDNRQKVVLVDETHDIIIKPKQFDDITKIILYQNILHYDDSYVNPEFKKMMDRVDSVRNFNKELPTLERKMYIITAHTGIRKKEQLQMTFREHQGIFEEVCGEIDFETTRAYSLFGGHEVEHWIYRNKKGKYDKYITSMGKYKSSFGGDSGLTDVSIGDGNSQVEQLLRNNNF